MIGRRITLEGGLRPAFALLLAALAIALAAEGPPFTLEDARAYVARLPEAAAEDVLTLDELERAVPEVIMPAGVLVITGNRVGWTWSGPLELSIAGHLAYTIVIPRASARAPRPPWWPLIAAGGAGLVAGILAGAWAVSR